MKKKCMLNDLIFDLHYNNQLYIDAMYKNFIHDPNAMSSEWKNFFCKYQEHDETDKTKDYNFFNKKNDISLLIQYIRQYGHIYANINPLKKKFTSNELNSFLLLNNKRFKKESISILQNLLYDEKNSSFYQKYENYKNIYCKYIGYEYYHIDNIKEKKWIKNYIENISKKFILSDIEKINLLNTLIKTEIFEKYLHSKFIGAKRFSIEGADVLIPMLKYIINYACNNVTSKVIFGMAHRGRLNVLVNVLKKKINDLCYEFSESYSNLYGTGDAKYHVGMKRKIKRGSKNIIIDLKYNPSHLEIINPVVMGAAKAYLEQQDTLNTNFVLPINIHGDAAIIGQGVNQELLNMSQTRGYCVGGTIHIVINNQIGFTTSDIQDIRSSTYCTDIAKMIQSPVFHVNADHPNSVIFATQLALDYRYKFKKDVFIDLVCYRRRGHNESDEPSVTQPMMYKKISQQKTISNIYAERLQIKKIINVNYYNNKQIEYRKKINILGEEKFSCNKKIEKKNCIFYKEKIEKIDLKKIFLQINTIPQHIQLHNRVHKIYQDRYNMATKNTLIDWGAAENLAYAILICQGISCRISGEDVARGTFFHRHSVVYDQSSGLDYIPLHHLQQSKGKFRIYNSVLSEEATLAFEYGYSIDSKKTINIWEAQFGDFVNNAQVVIDQFISSGEQKWGIKSNLIIFLPHGYEGQGPEHSSCRLERFLQLCAQNNMKVCSPSTAAQIYHILIKHAHSKQYRPLIILTPKSFLRNDMAKSSFVEIKDGYFKKVIQEKRNITDNAIKKIIFCFGKIYYELINNTIFLKNKNVILVKIEQLYPFPKLEILNLLNVYINLQEIIWCQEEPKNQGAWYYIYFKFQKILSKHMKLKYIGRDAFAAPAGGSIFLHKQQQRKIISNVLNII
ncbi:2-oxoglutarate dehydrogenase E1 component [Buchnera aphidicola]|uniref:2-oxoglutarate dehydrogenase E1 component n=1 Tax=Buchnera aphidicola TaxID=9 RepID=UPI0031B8A649